MIVPKTHELAARFSMNADATVASDESLLELTLGHSWYMHGHSLKWQTNGTLGKNTADGSPNAFVVLTQAQLIF